MVAALVEGNSIRSTVRMTGFARNTVMKLLVDPGGARSIFEDQVMCKLACKLLQCDEGWSFCYAKQKHPSPGKQSIFGYGDVWTWIAIDADTKLVPCWLAGGRDGGTATIFVRDLAGRLAHRVQLTTDGHKPYLEAVEDAFGADIDYAMQIKLYE